jgi:hypothetical protein
VPVSSPKSWNKEKAGKIEWLPKRKMFVLSLHFNAMTVKSAITQPRRIVVTIRIASSSASFARAARNIQRIAKPSSFVGVKLNLTP